MWYSKSYNIIVWISFMYLYVNALTRIDPLVATQVGLIRGLRASDGDYSMFMGIPYATVNESNPFGPSTPHTRFEDTFEAYDDSRICPQVEEFSNTITGTLDCLRLNVYVPDAATSLNELPVLVWIHGGGFVDGFSSSYVYGPQYLVKQDVILVTFNYRVGPYGFMCTDSPDIPGNQGLKDQLLALRWIKNNIKSFGGDANKITIFGQSAGGVSVDLHLIYGQENLFNQMIMQSGVGLCHWPVLEPDTLALLKLAENLGFHTNNTNRALEFLAASDSTLVIASTLELDLVFKPCVEKQFDNIKNFIHDYPVNIKKFNIRNMPILLGNNDEESLTLYEHKTPEAYSTLNVFYDTLEQYFNFPSEDLIKMESEIRRFYIGDEKISKDVKNQIAHFDSDFTFNHPIVRTINKYLDNGATNIYYYNFVYEGGRNYGKITNNITSEGITHADEIGYLFDVSFMDQSPSPEDQLVIDRLTTMWANFAKYGNPTPEISELLPVQWPVTTKDQQYYLHIDSDLKVEKRNLNSRMAMWNLFYKANKQYQLGYRINED